MSSFNAQFSAEVRAQLARKQLTSAQLAQGLGLSSSTISRLLSGQQRWSIDQANRASKWLGADLWKLTQPTEEIVA